MQKKDSLWVRWIHHKYVKGKDIWELSAKVDASSYWRSILKVRDQFKEEVVRWPKCNIAAGYRILQGKMEKFHCCNQVWNNFNVPKHSFI